jgi:hypothetical protein
MNTPFNTLSGVQEKCIKADLGSQNIDLRTWKAAWNSSQRSNVDRSHSQRLKDACTPAITCNHPRSLAPRGVPRVLMPEVTDEIVKRISSTPTLGIDVKEIEIPIGEFANSLVAQEEILLPKIQGQVKVFKEQEQKEPGSGFLYKGKPYLAVDPISGKYVVIDGHHSWGAINLLISESKNRNTPFIDTNRKLKAVVLDTDPISAIKACFGVGAWSNPFDPDDYRNDPDKCSHKSESKDDKYGTISRFYNTSNSGEYNTMPTLKRRGGRKGRSRTRRGRSRRGRSRRGRSQRRRTQRR